MYWIPVLLVAVSLFVYQLIRSHHWLRVVVPTALSALLMGIVLLIDYSAQTSDIEIWSGYIEDWEHTEEWDQYHPPVTTCTTDSNGKQSCDTKPGYWEHHPAENYLKTTDNGWFSINRTPDGKKMNDHFPNKTVELKEMFPEGTPTASRHRYTNKIQASYSVYKHKEIDLDDYPDLPAYPDKVRDQLYVDRIVGHVPKKEKANKELSKINTYLNKMIPDPDDPGKKRSYKQVNLIFVNLGENKPQEYGFALQDHWEGGNKNDLVVAFSLDKKGNTAWAYPFSWSESELLKIELKQYMEKQATIQDFTPIIQDVATIVEEKFERKEFADFNYLQIEFSTTAYVFIWLLSLLIVGVTIYLDAANVFENRRNRR